MNNKNTGPIDPTKEFLLKKHYFTRKFIADSNGESDLIIEGYNTAILIFLTLSYIAVFGIILKYAISIKGSTTSINDFIILIGKWSGIVSSIIILILCIIILINSFKPLMIYFTQRFRIRALNIVTKIPIKSDEITLTLTCDTRSDSHVSKVFNSKVTNKPNRKEGLFFNSVDIYDIRLPYYGRVTIQFNDIETSFSPVIRIIPSLYRLFSPEYLTLYIKP